LKFGYRLFLKVHLETVHSYEPDRAEELIKNQMKPVSLGPQDFSVRTGTKSNIRYSE
jgi:hypothetical protein